ncbi:hypothetical protein [Nocardia alni]|uniref:hypothetical protein n=1 Tax=Nocardia alni TaxID=2815723 RepID=UPI001C21755F|nr:hypothetical protein [Nocardia alni]
MADSSDFTALTKAAKGNYIRLDPQAAQDCAKMCSDLITELNSAINDATNLSTLAKNKAFGDDGIIPNAKDLADRYDALADSGDSSLQHVLGKHVKVVSDMMDTFIAAGRAYLTNENASAADISKYDNTIKALPR